MGTYGMRVVKPFMKWVGGKTQIIDEVISQFPTEMSNYHEPFVGGGSVLLALLSYRRDGLIKIHGNIYASDLNVNLINLYTNIRSSIDEFLASLRAITDEYSLVSGTVVNRTPTNIAEARTSQESYYYWIRKCFNELSIDERPTPRASAMILFLNKTCFRGVYREGPRGFNVPFGHYKGSPVVDEGHLREVSELIRDVVFKTAPFTTSLDNLKKQDFVYMDPPYAPENSTSFVSYTSDGFGIDKHQALFALCHEMKNNNVRMLMSNADVALVRDAFPSPPYQVKIVSCRRAIHSKEPGTRTNEVLIAN